MNYGAGVIKRSVQSFMAVADLVSPCIEKLNRCNNANLHFYTYFTFILVFI